MIIFDRIFSSPLYTLSSLGEDHMMAQIGYWRNGNASAGICDLLTYDQTGAKVLNYDKCSMVPCRDPAACQGIITLGSDYPAVGTDRIEYDVVNGKLRFPTDVVTINWGMNVDMGNGTKATAASGRRLTESVEEVEVYLNGKWYQVLHFEKMNATGPTDLFPKEYVSAIVLMSSYEGPQVYSENVGTVSGVPMLIRKKHDEKIEKCGEGFGDSHLCNRCEKGYSRIGKAGCSKCPEQLTLSFLYIVAGVLAVMIISIYTIRKTLQSASDPKSTSSMMIKIFLSYTQLVSLSGSFNLNWPDFLGSMFAAQQSVGSVGDQLISTDCVFNLYDPYPTDAFPLSYKKTVFYMCVHHTFLS
jgi:hypothetical protein